MSQTVSPDQLAAELLQQGERCALAGASKAAETLLAQAWTIAHGHNQDIANSAAWEMAWLLVRIGAYGEAAEWFDRVSAPPARDSQLWSADQLALTQLCLARADGPDRTRAPSPLPDSPELDGAPGAPAALPPLRITNLGRYKIVRDGTVLPVCAARKAIAIFRYLLAQRHLSAHKETLMELFWPDARPQDAAHSLHVAISALRRHLDPPGNTYVLLEAGSYAVNREAPIEDDRSLFLQASDDGDRLWRDGDLDGARQAYTTALAWYRGDYYVDSYDLEWAVAERERLVTRYLVVLDHLGHVLIALGQIEAALECYQHLLERDSYREDAHGQVMRCFQQLGRRGEALRQYERCVAILADELGIAPAPEIQELARAIASVDEVGAHATAERPASAAPEPSSAAHAITRDADTPELRGARGSIAAVTG